MYRYRYDSTSESSDSDCQLSLNPIKTYDLSYALLSTENVTKHIDDLDQSSDSKRHESIDTLLLIHNTLDTVPINVSKFSSLKRLDISNNEITTLPEVISCLPLVILIAKNNRLTSDGLPKSFRGLRHLKVCNFSGNHLSRFPEQCLEVTNLEYLYLGNNSISQLPNEISKLQR